MKDDEYGIKNIIIIENLHLLLSSIVVLVGNLETDQFLRSFGSSLGIWIRFYVDMTTRIGCQEMEHMKLKIIPLVLAIPSSIPLRVLLKAWCFRVCLFY